MYKLLLHPSKSTIEDLNIQRLVNEFGFDEVID